MNYKVENLTISGWENASWTIGEEPHFVFETCESAQQEIDEVCTPDGDYIGQDTGDYRIIEGNFCVVCGVELPDNDESNWCQECYDTSEVK